MSQTLGIERSLFPAGPGSGTGFPRFLLLAAVIRVGQLEVTLLRWSDV